MSDNYLTPARHHDEGFFASSARITDADHLFVVLELAVARPLSRAMTVRIRSCASLAHTVLRAGHMEESPLVGREEGLDLCAALLTTADELCDEDVLAAFALEGAGNRMLDAFVGRDDSASSHNDVTRARPIEQR